MVVVVVVVLAAVVVVVVAAAAAVIVVPRDNRSLDHDFAPFSGIFDILRRVLL